MKRKRSYLPISLISSQTACPIFTDRLPHAVGETAELLDEAALSRELFEVLSTETDEELAGLGIARDELSKVAAAASGLFVVANDRRKN
jgi:hypothetical protein